MLLLHFYMKVMLLLMGLGKWIVTISRTMADRIITNFFQDIPLSLGFPIPLK